MITSKQKQKLKKFISSLSAIKGRHTELVSVYIPAGYDLNKIIQHLEQEQSTAKNIKSKTTRDNVLASLERAIRHLRLYKKTPKNGLAVFAGNIAAQEGKVNIKVWSIEPPEPLKTRMYRCDQVFVLDLLKDMLEYKEIYGLIVLDRREATIGFLKGTLIKSTVHLTSGVPGKVKAGGQSAARYHRITEGMAKEFYKRIADASNKEFLGKKELKGLLIGGPGPTKEDFLEYLNKELRKKVIAVEDITYTDESGLQDLVDRSKDVLAKEIIAREKEITRKFFELLSKEPEKTAYGKKEVEKALKLGAVETLLLSANLKDEEIEELTEEAEKMGTIVEIISIETREGLQLKDLGEIAAILRFAIS